MRSTLRDPWCLLLALVASLSIACLIGRRSEDFACKTSEECPPGRGCFQGYCVVPECPDECICSELLPDGSGYADCTINCSGNKCRSGTITCPAGMACTVRCENGSECDRVDCSQATSCKVECIGSSTCEQGVTCGAGPCQVSCSGAGSCDNGVSCASSCRCDVACGATTACGAPATCPDAACTNGLGCTSAPGGACNECP